MKLIKGLLLPATACLLASCFGKEEKPADAAPAKPALAKPAPVRNPRPNRPPPPPQPQDGSMIVRPGGTEAKVPKISEVPGIDSVSAEDKDGALSAAEREITRRKKDAAEGDDAVSKALNNLSEDDIDRAFSELKKAAGNSSKTGE